MNILFISPCSPRESVGGIERYILNLIDYCKDQDEIKVNIMLPTENKAFIENEGNVKLYFDNFMTITPTMNSVGISKNARAFSDSVEKIIREEKIDIICAENFHISFPPAYSILLNMVAAIHNIPLVLRLHSFASTDLQRELVNQLMWDRISCVSISVAGDCFTKGADVNILSTEYLGVNTKEFNDVEKPSNIRGELGLRTEDRIVLTASRITTGRRNILREKGIINLIEAFSRISPRHPELKLLIAIGRPGEILRQEFHNALEKLKGYIMLRNIADSTLVKIFNLDQMPDVYREADLFVLASENETFGQVFIESMACGLPVIGTKVGGIPEIIRDSHTGYLVPPNDASILAQKMESILNDNSIGSDFAKAGKITINEKFTLEDQFSKFMSMLKSMLANNRSIDL